MSQKWKNHYKNYPNSNIKVKW